MYGARELAFRSEEPATSAAGRELLMASPFDGAAEDHDAD
jgi:hypothetical protein